MKLGVHRMIGVIKQDMSILKKKKMGKKKLIVVVVVVAAIVGTGLGTGIHFLTADQAEGVPVYSVASLCGSQTVGQNFYAGVIESQDTVDIKVDSGKKVKEVFVEVGDTVKKGTKLFEYDQSSMEDELTQAKIDLQQYDIDIAEAKSQIKALKEEKKTAASSEQLTYTLQIQLQENEITRTQYEKEKKKLEVDKLEKNMGNTVVTSEIEGKVTKINNIKNSDEDEDEGMETTEEQSDVLMKLTGIGNYRVKCQINELEFSDISEGMEMSVHSRVNDDVFEGVISTIDRGGDDAESTENGGSVMESDMMSEMGDTESSLTNSTSYDFYVELNDPADLMLGQHVYVTKKQEEQKEGLWLDEMYIVDADGDACVWVENARGKLEKREVLLGKYDEELCKYKIESGMEEDDWIAFPDESLEEGAKTSQVNMEEMSNGEISDGEEEMESMDGEEILNEEQ